MRYFKRRQLRQWTGLPGVNEALQIGGATLVVDFENVIFLQHFDRRTDPPIIMSFDNRQCLEGATPNDEKNNNQKQHENKLKHTLIGCTQSEILHVSVQTLFKFCKSSHSKYKSNERFTQSNVRDLILCDVASCADHETVVVLYVGIEINLRELD